MTALSFSVFEDKIISGEKTQTIRRKRKHPIKIGDNLQLYWKQQSPKHCRKLADAVCISVEDVVIDYQSLRIESSIKSLDDFAIADGFDNWQQLINYFEKNYELPFKGVLIKWLLN